MSVHVALSVEEQTHRNLDLTRRFGLAVMADPELLDEIPNGVHLVLLPDDDADLTATNVEIGLASLRRGEDVYFRHVRAADLPE